MNYLLKSATCLLTMFFLSSIHTCYAKIFPIQFSIPEFKMIDHIPTKDRDFASIIPGQLHTYIYHSESEYYKGYQRSYFAITCKKAGWDCMRHYEILANGCIPYFVDLDHCNPNTMAMLPRKLIKEAMNLPGVSYMKIDHSRFDRKRYYEILNELLEYTRKNLTTRAMASYLLKTVNYTGSGKILYLSNDPYPDYMRCLTLAGLKEMFGDRIIDVPKVQHIYRSYQGDVTRFHGKGFSYTRIVDDLPVNRDNIEERIKNKEFDIIIYGSVHRGLRYIDLATQTYSPEKIIYICGEDAHQCEYTNVSNLFLREYA